MEARIRLARFGAKKKPFYRIVVASKSSARDGRFKEVLGSYDPRSELRQIQWKQGNRERFDFWVSKGATPTDIVRDIVKNSQVH